MKKILYSTLVGFAALLAFSACTKSETLADVKSVKLNDVTIFVGETVEVVDIITPKNANTWQIVWTSSDENIATVTSGYVKGINNGSATIKAVVRDSDPVQELGSCNVTVKKHPVESITITPNAASMFKKKTLQLTAAILPENATYQTVTWESSDTTIAKVSDVGLVTAKIAGEVTITATADGKSATCAITVKNADDIDLWTGDEAGSHAIIGGDSPDITPTGDHFLSYSNGVVSWPANTTGKVRSDTLTIEASGSRIAVTQIGPAAFKGTWAFRTQRFSKNSVVCAAAADITIDVTLGDPLYGETLTDHDGQSYTNNIGLKGLYLDAVVDAAVVVDSEKKEVRFGLFLDERKAQAVENGNTTYPYVCFIPECGTAWNATTMAAPWNFVPIPISSDQNYQWLWFKVGSDLKTLQYDHPVKQYLYGKDGQNGATIIGITCAIAKNATPAASDILNDYNVIYQANPGKNNNVGGFMLTKK